MAHDAQRWPTLFIPHGGGPCFFMDPMPGLPPDTWTRMEAYLRGIDASLGVRPKAIVVVSGHWETTPVTVNAGERPPLLFDYFGFPEHTYRLTYPAAGSPELAARVRDLLRTAGIASQEDARRGFDHGVFVPFKVMYPDAAVPVVQLSLDGNHDAATHLAIGRALAPLRAEGVLIIGSGMSYHNLRELFRDTPGSNTPAEEFDRWLDEAATEPDPDRRASKLAGWQSAPGARASHPTPEHLLPLLVAAGAAGDDSGARTYSDRLMGKPVSGFQFG